MSSPEPTSTFPEVLEPNPFPEGTDVVMYMAASRPEECLEGYYWDGVQCVRKGFYWDGVQFVRKLDE